MSCDEILKAGLGQDLTMIYKKLDVEQVIHDAVSLSYDDAKSAYNSSSLGLDAVYDSLGIDFSSSDSKQRFENLQAEYHSDRYGQFRKNLELKFVEKRANPSVVAAWRDCVSGKRIAAFAIDAHLPKFRLSVTYTPRTAADPETIIVALTAPAGIDLEKSSIELRRFTTLVVCATKADSSLEGTITVSPEGMNLDDALIEIAPRPSSEKWKLVVNTQVTVAATDTAWLATGVTVQAEDRVRITSGTDNWSISAPTWGYCNAYGYSGQRDSGAGSPLCPTFNWGALVGRLSGKPFLVGLLYEGQVESGGMIELICNDNPNHPVGYSDNAGTQRVHIEVYRRSKISG